MKNWLHPCRKLAALGFVLSAAAHVLALTGTPIPGGNLIMGLHVGIFVVWIPAMLASLPLMRGVGGRDFWKVVLADCPPWMRRGLYGLFAYAILNFMIGFVSEAGHPKDPSGRISSVTVRMFSGHWMMFYAAAFAILHSRIRALQLPQVGQCVNGHPVAAMASSCPRCGTVLVQETGNRP